MLRLREIKLGGQCQIDAPLLLEGEMTDESTQPGRADCGGLPYEHTGEPSTSISGRNEAAKRAR